MKLTDQEQVILKAIGSGVAEVSRVIKAVGYPKATVKKVLVGLSEKGIVSLHRHDWPQSLTPADRKLMVRIGSNYYNAVSVMKRNPKSKGKTALKKTGRALKGFTRGALSAGAQILGAGAEALNPKRRNENYNVYVVIGKTKHFLAVVAATSTAKAKEQSKSVIRQKYPQGIPAGARIKIEPVSGQTMANPHRRIKVRNKYVDLVIKGQAKKTPRGWQVGKKTFAQGRGTVNVSSGYYLDKHTGMVYAKRERNTMKRKRRNVQMMGGGGAFPIRASADYDPVRAGESPSRKSRSAQAKKRRATQKKIKAAGGVKAYTSKLKTRKAARRKASSTTRTRSMVTRRKATTSRLAGRAIKKSSGLLKKGRKRNNPSAESIRKEFAGSVSGERDLFFPQGTPSGKLAKLGKLVSITTEEGTIKPVSGTAWLCADTRGRLHIGSVTGAPLFDGPKRSFGHVTKLEYESSKPHLGYKGPIIWFHKAGEENGVRPTLKADGKGGLVFKGGDYRLTRRGIEN